MNKQLQLLKPTMNPDGSCPACIGGWLCSWHQQEGLRRDREQAAVLRRARAGIRQNIIARICAEHELESDEFQTAEQKAELIMEMNRPAFW